LYSVLFKPFTNAGNSAFESVALMSFGAGRPCKDEI
jgi:hypothetical protein